MGSNQYATKENVTLSTQQHAPPAVVPQLPQVQPQPIEVRSNEEGLAEHAERLRKFQRLGNSMIQMGPPRFDKDMTSSVQPKPLIQRKLTIGDPGDKYEQEADRVASQVVQQINGPIFKENNLRQSIQREKNLQAEMQARGFQAAIQRKQAKAGGEATPNLESAINRVRGCGKPLDAGLQQSMGQAMGADFRAVRVHTDTQSDQLNQSIQARAFTTGQDVFFREGVYQPGNREGQELIAHELAHVMQQNREVVSRSSELHEIFHRDQSYKEPLLTFQEERVRARVSSIVPEKIIQRLPVILHYLNGYVAHIETDNCSNEQLIAQLDHPKLTKKSKEGILMALWERGIKLDINKKETSTLNYLSKLPDFPKQFIRINSFAFAKSKKIPIASHSYATCLGVVIHDHVQNLGGMAHIDLEGYEDDIQSKINLVIQSVKVMLESIKSEAKNLEFHLFAGTGLVDKNKDFSKFLEQFTSALEKQGIQKEQIKSILNMEDSAKLAVYFPCQGALYLDNKYKQVEIIDERSIGRIKYDGYDYEDQDEIKEKIQDGNNLIIEVVFNQEGKEINYIEYIKSLKGDYRLPESHNFSPDESVQSKELKDTSTTVQTKLDIRERCDRSTPEVNRAVKQAIDLHHAPQSKEETQPGIVQLKTEMQRNFRKVNITQTTDSNTVQKKHLLKYNQMYFDEDFILKHIAHDEREAIHKSATRAIEDREEESTVIIANKKSKQRMLKEFADDYNKRDHDEYDNIVHTYNQNIVHTMQVKRFKWEDLDLEEYETRSYQGAEIAAGVALRRDILGGIGHLDYCRGGTQIGREYISTLDVNSDEYIYLKMIQYFQGSRLNDMDNKRLLKLEEALKQQYHKTPNKYWETQYHKVASHRNLIYGSDPMEF